MFLRARDRAVVDDEVLPPVDVLGELVDAEIAHGCSGVTGGEGADGAGWVMGGGPDVILLGEVVDTLRFQQAAGFGDIDVHDGAALHFDEAAKPVAGVEVFAGADGECPCARLAASLQRLTR